MNDLNTEIESLIQIITQSRENSTDESQIILAAAIKALATKISELAEVSNVNKTAAEEHLITYTTELLDIQAELARKNDEFLSNRITADDAKNTLLSEGKSASDSDIINFMAAYEADAKQKLGITDLEVRQTIATENIEFWSIITTIPDKLSSILEAINNNDITDNNTLDTLADIVRSTTAFNTRADDINRNLESTQVDDREEFLTIRELWQKFPEKIGEKLSGAKNLLTEMYGSDIMGLIGKVGSITKSILPRLLNPRDTFAELTHRIGTLTDMFSNPREMVEGLRDGLGLRGSEEFRSNAERGRQRLERMRTIRDNSVAERQRNARNTNLQNRTLEVAEGQWKILKGMAAFAKTSFLRLFGLLGNSGLNGMLAGILNREGGLLGNMGGLGGGGLKSVLKVAGQASAVVAGIGALGYTALNLAKDTYSTYKTFTDEKATAGDKGEAAGDLTAKAGSAITMAVLGAKGGAALGSIIPGIGTAIGGVVGAGAGALVGYLGGEKFISPVTKWIGRKVGDLFGDDEKTTEETNKASTVLNTELSTASQNFVSNKASTVSSVATTIPTTNNEKVETNGTTSSIASVVTKENKILDSNKEVIRSVNERSIAAIEKSDKVTNAFNNNMFNSSKDSEVITNSMRAGSVLSNTSSTSSIDEAFNPVVISKIAEKANLSDTLGTKIEALTEAHSKASQNAQYGFKGVIEALQAIRMPGNVNTMPNIQSNIPSDIDSFAILLTNKTWGTT